MPKIIYFRFLYILYIDFDFDAWCVILNEKKCNVMASKGVDISPRSIGPAPVSLKLNLPLPFTSVHAFSVSFNHTLVALSTDNGCIYVMTSDFNKILHTYQSMQREPTKYLAWVANKAVVAYWDCLLLIPIDSDPTAAADLNNHTEM